MKRLIKYAWVAVMSCTAIASDAQNLEMGYFNKGFVGRQQLNPAIEGEYNTIALPALGGIHFGLRGNMGVKDYIYNRNGKTVTFMNSAVSADDFLKAVNGWNRTNF